MKSFYVGTYTSNSNSRGIYCCLFDEKSGKIEGAEVAAELDNPSFLTISPMGRWLFAVSEMRTDGGRSDSSVNAFSVDKTGELTFVNGQSSGGLGPCHVVTSNDGKILFVANYASGSTTSFRVDDRGTVSKSVSFFQHTGSGIDPDRQEGPHAHSVTLSKNGEYAYVADLGQDRVVCYAIDPESGALSPKPESDGRVKAGSGPRHIDVSADGRFFYLINELSSTVSVFSLNHAGGNLTEIQGGIPALPTDFGGESTAADIHLSNDGAYLYASNRGHDSVAIFRVNGQTGLIDPVGHCLTGGRTPRNFALSPNGVFLLAANQDSDSIVVFRIDSESGVPKPTGNQLTIPKPVCIQFAMNG